MLVHSTIYPSYSRELFFGVQKLVEAKRKSRFAGLPQFSNTKLKTHQQADALLSIA